MFKGVQNNLKFRLSSAGNGPGWIRLGLLWLGSGSARAQLAGSVCWLWGICFGGSADGYDGHGDSAVGGLGFMLDSSGIWGLGFCHLGVW